MKRPFAPAEAFERLNVFLRGFPAAGLYQLQELGFGSPFQILTACLLSIRTLDEVMAPASQRLFARAKCASELAGLAAEEIDALVRPVVFHTAKARQLVTLAEAIVSRHDGELPCDEAALMALPGIGPKCGHLALAIGCGHPQVSVDVHVHRVVNRWGIVQTGSPTETMERLEAMLPRALWSETNRLLMPFGKFVCTARLPPCSECPLEAICLRIGVTASR